MKEIPLAVIDTTLYPQGQIAIVNDPVSKTIKVVLQVPFVIATTTTPSVQTKG